MIPYGIMTSKKWRATPTYTSAFHKYLKRQEKAFQAEIRDVIEDEILPNPLIGVQKSGDLSDFWIHKFRYKRQEYLIAYRFPDYRNNAQALRKLLGADPLAEDNIEEQIEIVAVEFEKIGSHENFYEELKSRQK